MIRRQKKKRKLNADINVVPYIDVMMVLLVIFMITAPMLTQGVSVDLPQAASDPVNDQDQEPVVVTVDKDGAYYINIGGDDTTQVSQEEVSERVEKILNETPNQLLLVRGDKNVSYEKVVGLMALLQQAGAASVGLVTE
ncbi:protein TolR [Neptunomonas phycophila]|jgi:biopolymer transport protein TolR|uniref:Tol-Pal system protein TolR n=1 Tax=Neptunomonas phycophila TaxID=1572645 RepID=A0AAW7XDP5_9GAMM|nr:MULTISPECIES: protein TolR [Neptunomonas]MBT3146121.1 protein TolR [Neptunomonas phycophila]MDN2659720.1 protein TolR [Neptunomonas sp. CHC150]MDO6452245.1 protein TolR [Neptunomonas phycophila]MDO6466853.1 protein TolR [Neptunomonas phycophila]MDO6783209.1 protein TolR [Neptunomonas phycophila]